MHNFYYCFIRKLFIVAIIFHILDMYIQYRFPFYECFHINNIVSLCFLFVYVTFDTEFQIASHLESDINKDIDALKGNAKRESLIHGRIQGSFENDLNNHLDPYPSSRLRRWKPAPIITEHSGLAGEMGEFHSRYILYRTIKFTMQLIMCS